MTRQNRVMPQPLRIATFLAPNVFPVYRAVADHIGRTLGCQTDLVVGRSFDQFAAGEIDAGFICGLPYVRLAEQTPAPVAPLAAPVLAGDRYAGRPVYFSDVIVRCDSPFRVFDDLRGRTWAYNDVDSHSGHSLTRYHLACLGESAAFFGRIVAAGFHQRAIQLVAAGEVDAAAIDSQVLAVALRDEPELAAALRVIVVFGPSPIQPLVVARHLPDDLTAAKGDAVFTMSDDPDQRVALARGCVERFVPVSDADYDDIRRMLAVAEAAGVHTLA
jgi:phosphonate transport system substrate-binding protein